MARRNWSKAKDRRPTENVRFEPGIMAPLLRARPRLVQPTKAELQADVVKALAARPVTVKKLATLHTFRCLDCREYNRRSTQLVCAKCGSKNTQRAV